MLAALIGAIAWNLLTWWLGLPSTLVACADRRPGRRRARAVGRDGSRVARHRAQGRDSGALRAPPIAFAGGVPACCSDLLDLPLDDARASRTGRSGSDSSSSGTWVAFTHGANDAQKTMGVIALALFAHGTISHFYIPTWVKVAAGVAIGAGTYVGGWRIMRTLGQRIFRWSPPSGFAAQAAAGATIYLATHLGYPLSTTHVVSGAVMGAGATKRLSAVRWGVAGTSSSPGSSRSRPRRSWPPRSTGRCRRSSEGHRGDASRHRVTKESGFSLSFCGNHIRQVDNSKGRLRNAWAFSGSSSSWFSCSRCWASSRAGIGRREASVRRRRTSGRGLGEPEVPPARTTPS